MSTTDILTKMYSCLSSGDIDEANTYALEVLKIDTESAPAWYVVGEYQFKNKNFAAAETSFRCVTVISPKSVEAWQRLCESTFEQGEFGNAMAAYINAVRLDPSIERCTYYFRFPEDAKTNEARDSFLQIVLEALTTQPKSSEHYLLLCRYYLDTHELEKSSNAFLMATACDPENKQMLRSYGLFLFEIGFCEKAASVLLELTNSEPDEAENWQVLGACYFNAGNHAEAIKATLKVVALEPENVNAKLNLAMSYASMGSYAEAAEQLEPLEDGSNALIPIGSVEHLGVVSKSLYCHRYLGEMGSLSKEQEVVLKDIVSINDQLSAPIPPFLLLPLIDSPEIQHLTSKYAMNNKMLKRKALHHVERPEGKIRVGWFGSDFYDHATMYLLTGVFRLYDRDKFEFQIYDYGIKRDDTTKELITMVDGYYDLKGYEDHEIIELARSHELDIAIDLKGFTGGGKTAMFAAGLAPLHIFYLGYPGTSGKDFMDYMIADQITVPDDVRSHFHEKIIYMPNSYQPNDVERLRIKHETKREDWGLDPKALVLASFNQVYKISRDEVQVWARLLADIENSQLWFYCSGRMDYRSRIEQNVIREFGRYGITSEKLVFAYSTPIDKHLCRLRHADVFLDAFNVNGHTTVSDALFAGVPVVTKPGRQFAARVGASLVSAAGCGELIAASEEDYYEIALKIATDESYRNELKLKLAGVKKSALYDTSRYVSDLQEGLQRVVAISKSRSEPQDIWV